MKTPMELKSLYEQGHNISALLRDELGVDYNTKEIIEICYDLQTGSYVDALKVPEMRSHKQQYTIEIAKIISDLCEPKSILEAGVGEATTLSGVLQHLGDDVASYGFDLSWSRLACAQKWLNSEGVLGTTLCTGDLLTIPFLDNSIDVVYTSHSIEPNRGVEDKILSELYRVARRYVFLLEPSYELADQKARDRMDEHGYCRNLEEFAHTLGYKVLTHELFPICSNPLNPTALTVIEKPVVSGISHNSVLACPKLKSSLDSINGALFSAESLTVYPVIGGIACLRPENGVFASTYGR